jgi:hypothetical protein
MTQQEFNAKATELIKEMVNAIADKDFPRLAASIPPKLAWAGQVGADKTVENACLGFGKWLEEQLALWEEYNGQKYTMDRFDPQCLDEIDALNEKGVSFNTYNPASFGEQLDFWFEMEFQVKNEQISAVFDVNI